MRTCARRLVLKGIGLYRDGDRLKVIGAELLTDADKEEIRQEKAAILAWVDERDRGLLEHAFNAAISTMDRFLFTKCKRGPDEREMASDLYGAYVAWCGEEKFKRKAVASQRLFGLYLRKLGMARDRVRSEGNRHRWSGISLVANRPSEGSGMATEHLTAHSPEIRVTP